MFTEKEREVIRERRQKLLEKERQGLRQELAESFKHRLRKREFFQEYIYGIPLQILRSKYSGRKIEMAEMAFEQQEEPKGELEADYVYEKMQEQEEIIADLEFEKYSEAKALAEVDGIKISPSADASIRSENETRDSGNDKLPQPKKTKKAFVKTKNKKATLSKQDAVKDIIPDVEKEDRAFDFVKKRLRNNRSYPMWEIAKAAGVSERTLYRRLKGDPADWDTLKRFLDVLKGMNIGEIPQGEQGIDADGKPKFEAWKNNF